MFVCTLIFRALQSLHPCKKLVIAKTLLNYHNMPS
jgi:hypothetical protein